MHNTITTVIFTDKPFISGLLAPHLAQLYDSRTTLAAHLLLAGPARFDYPRGLPLGAYPLIAPPVYRLDATHSWMASTVEHLLAEWPVNKPAVRISKDETLDAIRCADTFVFAGDSSPSAIHAFRGTLALLRPDLDPRAEYRAYVLSDLSEQGLVKSLDAPTTTAHFAQLEEQCAVKRRFEFNWNQNALVLFGRALRIAGAPDGATLSKFGLQVLYFLQDHGAITDGLLWGAMDRWVGTGKYLPTYLGSCASRYAIVDQLHQAKLITRAPICELTPVGRKLLSLLHPGCEDADLPARLKNWMQEGLAVAQPAMDRYLKTVFGRQARYQQGNLATPQKDSA